MYVSPTNSGENIRSITKETIEVLPILNHKKTVTSLIFHAAMSNEAAVIVAKTRTSFYF